MYQYSLTAVCGRHPEPATQVAKIYGTMDDLRLENARVQEMYMAP